MSSFDLLRREIQEYIFDKRWPTLTKIQEASIKHISETENNFILSAPTASGKTEAAFLPAINSIGNWNDGLKVVYISPLKALINDQFNRISELCDYLDINVTSWHGEASQAKKKKLLLDPTGILLITPESIEAMLALRSGEAKNLFAGVEWILIDEIHGFLNNNRGIQLSSLTERLQRYMNKTPRYIGMSATLHDEDSQIAKRFFKNGRDTDVLVDRTRNNLLVTEDYFPVNIKKHSIKAVEKIYSYSQKESMLVFPNSREDVEYLSVNLSKMGEKHNSDTRYFAHHSSLIKELRLSAENFAKDNNHALFTICCTSTLELGIDIGSVDSIVQYNAPYSVSSLGQRLGRSGRRTKESILHFIATDPWELLQGLAAIALYEEGHIDRLDFIKKPYDVFAHQILSILLERSGLPISEFKQLHKEFLNWSTITDDEYRILVQHLIHERYVEVLEKEVITSLATEPLLKGPEFFAQFVSEDNFAVYDDSKKIGGIPLFPGLAVGVNFFLGAKVWKIREIDRLGKKIYVKKAIDGNPPLFSSENGNVSRIIRKKMKKILSDQRELKNYSLNMQTVLNEINSDCIDPENTYFVTTADGIGLRTFEGTRVNKTLQLFFDITNTAPVFHLDDKKTLIYSPETSVDIKEIIKLSEKINWDAEKVYVYLEKNPELINGYIGSMKYKELLPLELQIKYVIENILDIESASEFLNSLNHTIKG